MKKIYILLLFAYEVALETKEFVAQLQSNKCYLQVQMLEIYRVFHANVV